MQEKEIFENLNQTPFEEMLNDLTFDAPLPSSTLTAENADEVDTIAPTPVPMVEEKSTNAAVGAAAAVESPTIDNENVTSEEPKEATIAVDDAAAIPEPTAATENVPE